MACHPKRYDLVTSQRDSARRVLATALDLAPDAVSVSARLGDPAAWDSLAHLRLILAIEAELGHELDPAQIVEIECLDDIASLLAT
jgi:acyl carrier protein